MGHFFRRKLVEIAKNGDHNIDPWAELSPNRPTVAAPFLLDWRNALLAATSTYTGQGCQMA
jgi:hypothetical protein